MVLFVAVLHNTMICVTLTLVLHCREGRVKRDNAGIEEKSYLLI